MVSLIPFRRRGEVTTRDFGADPFDMFDAFFRPMVTRGGQAICPKIDVHEQKDKYVVKAELPGINPDDVKIDVQSEQFTISGSYESSEKKEEKDGTLIYSERRTGEFSRSFTLPGISEDKVDAVYKDGVLTVTLPKRTTAKEKTIAIRKG
jgi:HSP20 family protein